MNASQWCRGKCRDLLRLSVRTESPMRLLWLNTSCIIRLNPENKYLSQLSCARPVGDTKAANTCMHVHEKWCRQLAEATRVAHPYPQSVMSLKHWRREARSRQETALLYKCKLPEGGEIDFEISAFVALPNPFLRPAHSQLMQYDMGWEVHVVAATCPKRRGPGLRLARSQCWDCSSQSRMT
jgi:hypothetical protein